MPGMTDGGEDDTITDLYKSIFGIQPAHYWILHYQLQWFSLTAPLLSSLQTGIISVDVL
jgi:hypothetical protein